MDTQIKYLRNSGINMIVDENRIAEEARRVIQVEIDSLSVLKEKIDGDFTKAVMLIANSRKVIVSGIGKSGSIAKKISGTFASLGVPSIYLHPVEALHGDIGIVEPGDTAILLSKSGSTEEIVTLLPHLKARSAKIIAIVGNMNSYLSRMADISLDGSVNQEACPYNIAPTSSSLVALALGDALAVSTMMMKHITIEDYSRQHPLGQIGRNLSLQVKDVMNKGDFLPAIDINSGFRDAIIEISNKGLGCVCVVDEGANLKGIITDGDVRRVLQVHEDIRGLKTIDIMTKNPVSIKENCYIGEALTIMENRKSQIAVLPVLNDENKCVGVLRIHDIVRSGL